MGVFRIEKNKNYVVMSNYHLKDKRLTLKSKGLLSLMLSLPDDWDYTINGLVSICKENETSIKSSLKELKDNGYLIINKLLPNETSTGRIEYEYNIYENPKQDVEKQDVENQPLENQPQLNINKLNIKDNKKESSKQDNKKTSYDEIINNYTDDEQLKTAIYEFIKMRKMKKKPITDRALQTILNKLNGQPINEQIYILDNSIINCWTDVYPKAKKNTEVSTEAPNWINEDIKSQIMSDEEAEEFKKELDWFNK